MSREEVPWTREEDDYFAEIQRLRDERDRLAAAVDEAAGAGAADRVSEQADWFDSNRRAGRGGCTFQAGFFAKDEAFAVLKDYLNSCPDNTELWISQGSLHVAYGKA